APPSPEPQFAPPRGTWDFQAAFRVAIRLWKLDRRAVLHVASHRKLTAPAIALFLVVQLGVALFTGSYVVVAARAAARLGLAGMPHQLARFMGASGDPRALIRWMALLWLVDALALLGPLGMVAAALANLWCVACLVVVCEQLY